MSFFFAYDTTVVHVCDRKDLESVTDLQVGMNIYWCVIIMCK